MAAADATVLANLKTARDYVLAKIAAGQDVISYTIGDRSVGRKSAVQDLIDIEKLISIYAEKVEAADTGGVTHASFEDMP